MRPTTWRARTIGTVGVIGSGVQARHQVRSLRVVRSFERIVAWSPNRARLDAYCTEMSAEGYEVVAAESVESVCAEADVLITATPSRDPLVRAEWLREGMHVTALGSDSPGKRELDPACLGRADLVVVDRYSQCAAFGELKHALDAGVLAPSSVVELGRIVSGEVRGRTTDVQITDRRPHRRRVPGHRNRVRCGVTSGRRKLDSPGPTLDAAIAGDPL